MSNSYDQQSKVILERINQTEKNAKTFAASMACVCRKESKSRDKLDELAKTLKSLADNEVHNDTSEKALNSLSISLVHLADAKDMQCSRIEEKIINELCQYEIICRNAKDEIKSLSSTRNDLSKRRSSELSRKMRNQGYIESDIMTSNLQFGNISKEMLTVGETFEKQRIADMKEILSNFILIQMKCLTTSMEILTNAYQEVQAIDVKKDFEQFNKHLQQHENSRSSHGVTFGKALSILSQSASNLDRLGRRAKSALKNKSTRKSQSSMSLDSLSSNSEIQEVRKESKIVEVHLSEHEEDETTSNDSDDTDLDTSDSDTDDITETTNDKSQEKSIHVKSLVNREHAI